MGTEAQKYVWEGAIPLQIHLHESEITTLPSPPPALILGPRLGYLPLLVPLIEPYFKSTLPPGTDTVWFEYKGLPLKWYIPTGVLFDFLCLEPERPWNLTVHFRGYPEDLLSPCDGEETVKWSFINSLKEAMLYMLKSQDFKDHQTLGHFSLQDVNFIQAAYIISGNCKNVMNMSQSDQLELWRSFINCNMEGNLRISSKLKFGTLGGDSTTSDRDSSSGPSRTGRIPVRLYVRSINKDRDDLEDAPSIENWDNISYINRPVEIQRDNAGNMFTLRDAIKSLLPDLFHQDEQPDISRIDPETTSAQESTQLKLVRVQGIEPKLDIPFTWVVNNLMNPDHFLHLIICVQVSQHNKHKQ